MFYKKDINFIPNIEEIRKRTKEDYFRVGLIAILLIFGINFIFLAGGYTYYAVRDLVYRSKIDKIVEVRDLNAQLLANEAFFAEKVEALADIKKDELQIKQYMDKLAKVLPSNFEMTDFEMRENGEIYIKGEVSNETVAIDLLQSVRNSGLIIDARFDGEIGREVSILGSIARI